MTVYSRGRRTFTYDVNKDVFLDREGKPSDLSSYTDLKSQELDQVKFYHGNSDFAFTTLLGRCPSVTCNWDMPEDGREITEADTWGYTVTNMDLFRDELTEAILAEMLEIDASAAELATAEMLKRIKG